jgi:hypothetical protein
MELVCTWFTINAKKSKMADARPVEKVSWPNNKEAYELKDVLGNYYR